MPAIRTSRIAAVKFTPDGMEFVTRDKALIEIIKRAAVDLPFFCKTFLSDSFKDPFTSNRLKACEMISDSTIPRLVIVSWRGFGKSELLTAKMIQDVCFRRSKFILYIGSSLEVALMRTDDIRIDVMTNDKIRDVFGDLRQFYTDASDVKWAFSKRSFFFCDPYTEEPFCFVTGKGCGQVVRGLKVKIGNRTFRPTLVAVDDLEGDEDVTNDDVMDKIWRWFNSSVKHVVPKNRPNENGLWDPPKGLGSHELWVPPWRQIVVDSWKSSKALAVRLLTSPEWHSAVFGKAYYDNESQSWRSAEPELFTDDEILREIEVELENGTFENYQQEMLCSSVKSQGVFWSQEMFQYFDPAEEPFSGIHSSPEWFRFIVVDPARSISKASAFSAMLAVAVNPTRGIICLLEEFCQRVPPEVLEEEIFSMAERHDCDAICVEETGLHLWVRNMMESAATKRNWRRRLIYLKAGTVGGLSGDFGTGKNAVKRARAALFYPYYRPNRWFEKGHVWHSREIRGGRLETAMCQYPDVVYWDLLDCVGHIPQVMAECGIALSSTGVKVPVSQKEKRSNYDRLFSAGAWRIA